MREVDAARESQHAEAPLSGTVPPFFEDASATVDEQRAGLLGGGLVDDRRATFSNRRRALDTDEDADIVGGPAGGMPLRRRSGEGMLWIEEGGSSAEPLAPVLLCTSKRRRATVRAAAAAVAVAAASLEATPPSIQMSLHSALACSSDSLMTLASVECAPSLPHASEVAVVLPEIDALAAATATAPNSMGCAALLRAVAGPATASTTGNFDRPRGVLPTRLVQGAVALPTALFETTKGAEPRRQRRLATMGLRVTS